MQKYKCEVCSKQSLVRDIKQNKAEKAVKKVDNLIYGYCPFCGCYGLFE